MSMDAKPIPSPMTEQRLLVMQRRREKQMPLAVPADQASVTKSIRARGQKTAKDGHRILARAVGHKRKTQTTKEARFDEEGDEIESWHQFAAVDQYLETEPGSHAAAMALAAWRREMGRTRY